MGDYPVIDNLKSCVFARDEDRFGLCGGYVSPVAPQEQTGIWHWTCQSHLGVWEEEQE